jgi:hydantoinase/carbamoylase family amidase
MGGLPRSELAVLHDSAAVSLEDALRSVGFNPDEVDEARWPPDRAAAFFELHIEQGQVLESERRTIGLVESIAGSTRFRVSIQGQAVHSGTTPMHLRHDAVAAAGELIVGIESTVNDYRHRSTVATVGRLEVFPNSITTIAGNVVLYVDVRDIDNDRQREAANRILELAWLLEDKRGVQISADIVSDSSPSMLPTWLRRITAEVCEQLEVPYRVMPSGAGHDAAIVASVLPAAMIFVPSQAGISHSPDEWTSPEDIATGAHVLYHSILSLDDFLARGGRTAESLLPEDR